MKRIVLLSLMAVMVSCTGKKENGPVHEHETVEAASFTLFTDQVEFYTEYSETEEGTYEFLVHVTDLSDYSPVESGIMTLSAGDRQVTEDSPGIPGIYHIAFSSFPENGCELILNLGASSGLPEQEVSIHIEAVHEEEEHGEVATEEEHHEHAHPEAGEVVFTKEQAWKSDFMVTRIEPVSFAGVFRASGQLLAMPGKKRHIPARADGIVQFANKNLVQGTWVEAGDLLFVISARSLTGDNLELRFGEYEAALEKSRSEYLRYQKLFREKVIPEKQLVEARSLYISDSLRFQSLASNASKDGLKITAPVSGYIHELNFAEGQYVASGEQLATISSDKQLLLRVDVPMQFYPLLSRVETAHFRTAYSERIYTVEELNGRLLARGSSVAENDHFIPLYFELQNDKSLLEGSFMDCYLLTSEKEEKTVVSVSALLEEQGNFYVYRQVTGESYTKVKVVKGESDGMQCEILQGIAVGDRIVTDGAMLVKAASMVVGDGGHGHSH